MSTDHIRYDLLAQNALRGVVRRVLMDAARDGLPGEHHFYISFKTRFPGVKISSRLGERYQDEITVVLQHQFWDLVVTETGFEVGLSFGNAPEKLVVPFEAVCGFFDPSVQFGLKFEVVTDESAPESGEAASAAPAPVLPAAAKIKALPGGGASHETARGGKAEPAAKVAKVSPRSADGSKSAAESRPAADKAAGEKPAKTLKVVPPADETTGGEKIVSLDTFRKKK